MAVRIKNDLEVRGLELVRRRRVMGRSLSSSFDVCLELFEEVVDRKWQRRLLRLTASWLHYDTSDRGSSSRPH